MPWAPIGSLTTDNYGASRSVRSAQVGMRCFACPTRGQWGSRRRFDTQINIPPMARRKLATCKRSHCNEAAALDGFCSEHHAELVEERDRRDEAVRVLHRGLVDDRGFEKAELREEFIRIQKWWHRACDATNYHREDPVLRDEASFALNWCISLAILLIREERSHRCDPCAQQPYDNAREWVWDRFRNLEAGLMSNGVPRRVR